MSCLHQGHIPNDILGRYILSSFYRPIITKSSGCNPEPINNYTPYNLFCIKTQLYPHIWNTLGFDVVIKFSSVQVESNLYVSLEITDGNNIVKLNKEQDIHIGNILNNIISNSLQYCLLFSYLSPIYVYNKRVSTLWIKRILPYIHVPDRLDPYVNDNGLYINMTNIHLYLDLYNLMAINVKRNICNMYKQGYITLASSIQDTWQLQSADQYNILFYPNWTNKLFAPDLVQFLTSRLVGDKNIQLYVGDNLVVRHTIAQQLKNDVTFSGSHIIVSVSNFQQAQQITTLILEASTNTMGQVQVHYRDTIDQINTLKNQYPIDQVVTYKTYDNTLKYVLSIKIFP